MQAPDVRTDLRPVCAAVVLAGMSLGRAFDSVLLPVLVGLNALWATPLAVFLLSGSQLTQKTALRRARTLDLADVCSVWNTGRSYGEWNSETLTETSIEITCWAWATRRLRRAIGGRLVELGRSPATTTKPDPWAWKMLGLPTTRA
jgi:hypothetical protein